MRLILCLAILLASCAWADEATDQAALGKTIEMLNAATPDRALFTADFRDDSELAAFAVQSGTMRVEISHEPWREAVVTAGQASRFVIRSARFITPDVALVDATGRHNETTAPVMLILKRDGSNWRVASVRATIR